MKKTILVVAAALLTLAGRAALPQPDLIAQIHFAGGDRIAADKSYSAFTNEFSSPEALALRKQTADKLAPWLAGWLQAKLGTTTPDGAAKLRPLFDDLQMTEWFLEARAATGDKPDVAIAIKLPPARAQAWETTLKPYFPAATFKQSAGWLIFDSGTGVIKVGEILAKKIAVPQGGWFSVDINWPRLAQWYPDVKELALPETLFDIVALDANLTVSGKFFFPENLSFKLDTWQFPSNTVHQPMNSFTAVRGFAGWLGGQAWAEPVKLSPPANQAFIWAVKGGPYQTYLAVPVADSSKALQQVTAGIQPAFEKRNANNGFAWPGTLETSTNEIKVSGEPLIEPYVQAISEPSGNFLLAGESPNPLNGKPVPSGLLERLAPPNLVFYHWEITAQRLPLLLTMSQLTMMLTRHRQLEGEAVAYKWLDKVGPTLGNTGTEITQTAPDQLSFMRKAPGGLTAFEFLTLAHWLETPDFPHFNLSLPPIPERVKRPSRAKHPAPAAMPGTPQ